MEEPLVNLFYISVTEMSKGSSRVINFIKENGINARLVTLSDSTRTSQLAAKALNCTIGEIAKSIVFLYNNIPIIIVISGDKRIDMKKLDTTIGGKVKIADADNVKKKIGYSIGGVPPFPHNDGVIIFLDISLKRFDKVWTAAGTPNSVMNIEVQQLLNIVKKGFVDLAS